ncbi:MAG: hypothetical protein J5733_06345 [Bacteroidaceae bacterium]|nr:hypothetical protein [Bacteroidaceae bacterium]
MKVHLKGVNVSVTTKKNSMPTKKPVAGSFRMSEDWENMAFVEDDRASVIYGEPKSHRVMRGDRYSVMWDSKREEYIIRVRVKPDPLAVMNAEWNCEDCINFIKRKIKEQEQRQQENS